jgi:hypothetical protein
MAVLCRIIWARLRQPDSTFSPSGCKPSGLCREARVRLKYGFRRSIVQEALEAPPIVDLKAITWLFKLPGLAENSKIEEFVARIPGVIIVQLMRAPVESRKVFFREHLLTLLRSCAPGTVGLDEVTRTSRRRLLACLDAIHHIVKASSVVYGVSHQNPSLVTCGLTLQISALCERSWLTAILPSASFLAPFARCSQDTCANIRLKSRSWHGCISVECLRFWRGTDIYVGPEDREVELQYP